jgi:hypothetical protein
LESGFPESEFQETNMALFVVSVIAAIIVLIFRDSISYIYLH